ncbi:MAG: transglutaminase family protein [Planctomycetaceae bacterium]|nr:trypsin-like peptidase domain-containing protein [Planctomycetaceae bacterium]
MKFRLPELLNCFPHGISAEEGPDFRTALRGCGIQFAVTRGASVLLFAWLLACPLCVHVGRAEDAQVPPAGGATAAATTGTTDDPGKASDFFIELARKSREAIVTVTHQGREGQDVGLGTGFIIDEQGLIATNMHVIGEARPIQVQFYDGSKADVASVHATDPQADLAILRIEKRTEQSAPLQSLPLAKTERISQGDLVAAIGHPQGLKNTLVAGLISGYQEINSRQLIQVGMAIDHGNSGGPLLNRQGEVIGIITYKSGTTVNLGFAMPVVHLRNLLDAPNPISMQRWVTIGALNATQWTPLMGATWRQRAGRIQVSGQGRGFGGRSLCLSTITPDDARDFEMGVWVKLEKESGAAGLVFHSDGQDRHYGFYPSAGKLRLSRFDGADVFQWQVLREVPSESYRPGEWNYLRIRVQGPELSCYCNDQLVVEFRDDTYTHGRVGLAKFRDTEASFKGFAVGQKLSSPRLASDLSARLLEMLQPREGPSLLEAEFAKEVSKFPETSGDLLEAEAKRLEQRALALRQLASLAHEQRVLAEIEQEFTRETPDLARLALLLARYDNPEVDVTSYREMLRQMAQEIRGRMADKNLSPTEQRGVLNAYLFKENGYHGSRNNYYNKSNSYLNEVLDDREGLPISLSVLYIVLGQELGLDIRGIGLPGHFIVCHYLENQPGDYLDIFEQASVISPLALQLKLNTVNEAEWKTYLEPQPARKILTRMIRNLQGLAEGEEDYAQILRYLNLLAHIDTENAVEHRYLRALLLIRNRDRQAAEQEIAWLRTHVKPGEQVEQSHLDELQRFADRWLSQPEARD